MASLARLSAGLSVAPAHDDLVASVEARIRSLPIPTRPSPVHSTLSRIGDVLQRHRRVAIAATVALLLGLLAVTPAGARIAQSWTTSAAGQASRSRYPASWGRRRGC
jgi:hypothetical protein